MAKATQRPLVCVVEFFQDHHELFRLQYQDLFARAGLEADVRIFGDSTELFAALADSRVPRVVVLSWRQAVSEPETIALRLRELAASADPDAASKMKIYAYTGLWSQLSVSGVDKVFCGNFNQLGDGPVLRLAILAAVRS